MKNLFAVCIGCVLVIGLGGVNVAVSEELEETVITTTIKEKENVQPKTEEPDEPDPKPETEEPIEEEPEDEPENEPGEDIEQEEETAPETSEESDSSPNNQEKKHKDSVDTTDKEKQKESVVKQKERVIKDKERVTSPSPRPVAPPVEESDSVLAVEEVQDFFISDYGELLSKWKHEFDVLYIPVLYDLLRYYAENDSEVIELGHLSKSQLSELTRFLDEEPQVSGATYSPMREAVEEYLNVADEE
ncbi:hypothetical protein [Sutcliffiella horikoshii]|uniref:hypothetical protein n=1 Tax=Sutcliffiella horikoshii TaxID=79883 RepID=UPI00384A4A47